MLVNIFLCLAVATVNAEYWMDRDFAAEDLLKFATAEATYNPLLEDQKPVSERGESNRYQQVVAAPPGFLPRSARRLDEDTQGYGWEGEARQGKRRQSVSYNNRGDGSVGRDGGYGGYGERVSYHNGGNGERVSGINNPLSYMASLLKLLSYLDGAEYDSRGNRVRHPKNSNYGYNNRRQQHVRRPQANVYDQGRLQAQRLQQAARLQAIYPNIGQQRIRRQPESEAEPAFQPQNKPRILRPVEEEHYQTPQSQVAPAFSPQKESQRSLRPVEDTERYYRKKPQTLERTFKKTKSDQSEQIYDPAASHISERRSGSLEGETFQPRYEPYAAPKNAYEPSYGGPPEQKNLEAAVAAGAAAYNPESYSEPQRLQFQIHGQGGPNSYRFGYDTGAGYNRQFRYEERDDHGILHGRYGYYDQAGKLQIVNYTADPVGGFHAEGDHVPKPQY